MSTAFGTYGYIIIGGGTAGCVVVASITLTISSSNSCSPVIMFAEKASDKIR